MHIPHHLSFNIYTSLVKGVVTTNLWHFCSDKIEPSFQWMSVSLDIVYYLTKLGFMRFFLSGKTYLPGFDFPDSPGCTVDLLLTAPLTYQLNTTWLTTQEPELPLTQVNWHYNLKTLSTNKELWVCRV
jgi:hypothetical protein